MLENLILVTLSSPIPGGLKVMTIDNNDVVSIDRHLLVRTNSSLDEIKNGLCVYFQNSTNFNIERMRILSIKIAKCVGFEIDLSFLQAVNQRAVRLTDVSVSISISRGLEANVESNGTISLSSCKIISKKKLILALETLQDFVQLYRLEPENIIFKY